MKTRHLTAGIIALFVLSGYVLGQTDPWTRSGSNVYPTNYTTDKVGIGTTGPDVITHILGSNPILQIDHNVGNSGTVGIRLTHVNGSNQARKVGIFSEAVGSWGRGHLHFAVDTATDNGDVALSDAKMTIHGTSGYVGIGTGNPGTITHLLGTNPELMVEDATYTNTASLRLRTGSKDAFIKNTNTLLKIYGGAGDAANIEISASDISNQLYLKTDGNVGIGTISPGAGYKLDVAGSIQLGEMIHFDPGGGHYFSITNPNSTTEPVIMQVTGYNFTRGLQIGRLDGNHKIILSGNVGIGTTNPQSKLAVNGTITAKEVEVTSTGWPDHVFADNYRLMPLREVADYIKTNRRLPDMPSANEVAEKGVALGEMQARLLQKVEELTLYVIELQKENQVLKGRVAALER